MEFESTLIEFKRDLIMTNPEQRLTKALILAFTDIPFEGLKFETSVAFKDLFRPEEAIDPELLVLFKDPVHLTGQILPVASKVDLRGRVDTNLSCECDRCNIGVQIPVNTSLDTFLMASKQFSAHDKPGGKVIHAPVGEVRPSRHRSRTKAPILSDAEGEHEDENFGAFDGHTLDLRPLVKELLILQIPMKVLCDENCKGLCLVCGENANLAKCSCPGGPSLVSDQAEAEPSPLALALQKKLSS